MDVVIRVVSETKSYFNISNFIHLFGDLFYFSKEDTFANKNEINLSMSLLEIYM